MKGRAITAIPDVEAPHIPGREPSSHAGRSVFGSQSASPSNLRYPTPPARVPLATGAAFLMVPAAFLMGFGAGLDFLATCLVPNLGRLNLAVTLTGIVFEVCK